MDITDLTSNGRLPYKPKVAVVAHTIVNKGGMERTCWEVIERGSQDYSFIAITSYLAPELRPLVDRWIRIRIPAAPAPLRFLMFLIKASVALWRSNTDLIHTVGAIVSNRVNVITVQFCHAGYRQAILRSKPRQTSVLRRFNEAGAQFVALAAERWCYRGPRVDVFGAVSQGVAKEVRRHYGPLPIAITPNGVDPARFKPNPVARKELRDTLLGENQVVALFVGGDWHRKGLALAIEALAVARESGLSCSLWVLGSGPYKVFQALAQIANISEHVNFLGDRQDTERFYQGADMFVLPSAYETFSLASFEAAASGLPLIIPAIHGASELVANNEAGIIIERNSRSIGMALKKLGSDPELRLKLGEEARRRASKFTWERSAKSTFELYESVLSTHPARTLNGPQMTMDRLAQNSSNTGTRKGQEGKLQRVLRTVRSNVMPDHVFYLPVMAGPARGTKVPVNFTQGIRAWLGVQEIEVSGHLGKLVEGEGISFDIGASFGYYSLALARAGSKKVYAFDPDKEIFQVLLETVRRNRSLSKAIQPHNFALGKAPGSMSIDTFVQEDPKERSPQFMKIDVEGAEVDVLEGAIETLRISHPRILLEVHSDELRASCIQILSGMNYVYRIVRPQTVWPELRPLKLNEWIIAVHHSDSYSAKVS